MLKFQQKRANIKKYLSILEKCQLFYNVTPKDIQAMVVCLDAKIKTFKKGTFIFTEGSPAKYLGIVLLGAVQIIRTDFYGNRSILACLEQSQIFGESFACAGADRLPVNAVACKDTQVMIIDVSRITHFCGNACEFHNMIIYNLLKIVAEKNLAFNEKIEITSKRNTKEKLMAYLTAQAKLQKSTEFNIPLDRQGLADYLGVERSGLSAEISKLRKDKIIESNKNHFKLLQ